MTTETPSGLPGRVRGTVFTGLGQGAKFLVIDWVARELQARLHIAPFPGTLNLRVAAAERERIFAARKTFLRISDASAAGCPGYLRKVLLHANRRTVEAYLIVPEITAYTDVLEVISPMNLREHLAVSDGDSVDVEFSAEGPSQWAAQ